MGKGKELEFPEGRGGCQGSETQSGGSPYIQRWFYLVYFPTRAKESTINMINIPKNEYNITSSVTLFVLSSCCSSNRCII
jgi:hypothetical protein